MLSISTIRISLISLYNWHLNFFHCVTFLLCYLIKSSVMPLHCIWECFYNTFQYCNQFLYSTQPQRNFTQSHLRLRLACWEILNYGQSSGRHKTLTFSHTSTFFQDLPFCPREEKLWIEFEKLCGGEAFVHLIKSAWAQCNSVRLDLCFCVLLNISIRLFQPFTSERDVSRS